MSSYAFGMNGYYGLGDEPSYYRLGMGSNCYSIGLGQANNDVKAMGWEIKATKLILKGYSLEKVAAELGSSALYAIPVGELKETIDLLKEMEKGNNGKPLTNEDLDTAAAMGNFSLSQIRAIYATMRSGMSALGILLTLGVLGGASYGVYHYAKKKGMMR